MTDVHVTVQVAVAGAVAGAAQTTPRVGHNDRCTLIFRVSDPVRQALDAAASRAGRSRSSELRLRLRESLARLPDLEPAMTAVRTGGSQPKSAAAPVGGASEPTGEAHP